MHCSHCHKPTERKIYKHYSNKCQAAFQYQKYLENWKAGLTNSSKSKKFPQILNHLKRFLPKNLHEGKRAINVHSLEGEYLRFIEDCN